jgi:hypothetical protein
MESDNLAWISHLCTRDKGTRDVRIENPLPIGILYAKGRVSLGLMLGMLGGAVYDVYTVLGFLQCNISIFSKSEKNKKQNKKTSLRQSNLN